MDLRLTGTHVLITGGTRGIGLACARLFLDEGARVSLCGRSTASCEAAVRELDAGERVDGETGWGGSDLRTYKYNLFGYGAYNVCPFTCGYYFPSGPDSINRVAYMVRHDYLDSTGSYYYTNYGPTLTGMNVKYATDQNWKNGIASLMLKMREYDSTYYSNTKELVTFPSAPPSYGREIPSGQPYPKNTIINFQDGIVAKIVNTDSLNFRSLPYVSSSTVISSVNQSTTVKLLGINTDVLYDPTNTGNYKYRWYRANVNGQTGWLYGEYLAIANLLQVDLDSGSLNIRSSNSATAGIKGSVSNGTYLKAVTNNGTPVISNNWYKVYLPNSTDTGWVSAEFVKRITH